MAITSRSGGLPSGSVRTCDGAEVFPLTDGENKTGVNFQLDPGGVIKGTVFKTDGETPVTDGSLYVAIYSGDPCGGNQQIDYQYIDQNGAYEIKGLPAGSNYFVRVRVADGNYIEEWWADPASVRTCGAAGVFTLNAGETKEGVNFQLDPGSVIKGTVFKSDGTTPVTDATLYVDVYSGDPCGGYAQVGQKWIYPENNGAYEISGLPAGSDYFVRVHVYEGNYIPEWWASSASVRTCDAAGVFTLTDGETKEGVNFQLDPGAVIKGTVFKSDGETPVNDATLYVQVYSGNPCGENVWVSNQWIYPGNNGVYEIDGLPTGSNYFVKIEVNEGNYIAEWWAPSASVRTCDAAEVFALDAGATKEGVNFQLDPGGVIRGTVFKSDGETPVTDATLYVDVYSGDPCGNNAWVGQRWIYPGNNGAYEIGGLPTGSDYFVRVRVADGNYIEEWWAPSGSVRTCAEAGVFSLDAGVTKESVNFQLEPGGVIKGTVFKTDGQTPVTDAYLSVTVYSGDPCGNLAQVGQTWTYPGNNGDYEISGLPAGENYFVRVNVYEGNYFDEWWASSASVGTCDAAEVFSLDTGVIKEGVNFQLDPGGVIKGTVFKTDGVTPVTDTTLYVAVLSGDPCGAYEWVGYQYIYPDDNGAYEISRLPAGTNYFVNVQVLDGNYFDEWWASSASGRTCDAAEVFNLNAGATKEGMNFQLDPGAVIKGTVFKSDGETPVTDASLYVAIYSGDPCGGNQWIDYQYIDQNGAYEITGLPAASDYFVRVSVDNGNYIPEYWASSASVRTCDTAGVFALTDGETKEGVNFQLDPGGVIKGTVFQSDGETPVTDATLIVEVYSGDPCGQSEWVQSQWINSDDNGTYEMSRIPTGSNYFVRVSVDEGNYLDEWWADPSSVRTCDAAEVFALNEGATKTGVNFQLDPGGVIKGTVFQSDGETPVTDASLYVMIYSGDPCGASEWVDYQWIDSNGTYEISGLPAGANYFVRVSVDEGNYLDEWWADPVSVRTCDAAALFTLNEGTTKTAVNFQLDPGGVIKGTVFKSDGLTPVTDVDLQVVIYSGDPCGVSDWIKDVNIAGGNGTYEIGAIPPGTNYFLRTSANEGNYLDEWWDTPTSVTTCEAAEVFTITEGVTKIGLNFQLDPGAVITGTVYRDDGSTPLGSMFVLLSSTADNQCVDWWNRGFLKSAQTAADGTYRLEGVTPGSTYYLTALDLWMGDYAEEWWTSSQSTTACYQAEAITIPAVQEYPGFNFQLDINEPDWDGDGIATVIEDRTDVCTDSRDADTDDDGIADGDEDANHNGRVDPGETDSCDADSDGDGIQDGTELGITSPVADPDGDGPSKGTDVAVFVPDADPSTTTDPRNADMDGDGLKDGEEDANFNGKVDDGETDPEQKDGKDSSPIYFPVQTPDGKTSIIFIE